MYSFHPYFTNDGSVGLYNTDFDDIYHSATGALTEAYEKFIAPVDMDKLMKKNSVAILDICYGIGYNSKSFLNYFFHAVNNIYSIHTNNIMRGKNIVAIDTDNILPKIFIKAVDNDKILSYLSPFIKTGENNFTNQKFDFNHEKIDKYLTEDKKIKAEKIDPLINFLIFENLAQNQPDFLSNEDVIRIINDKKYKPFLEGNIKALYKFYQNRMINNTPEAAKGAFLHNICYRYISRRYKNDLKRYNLADINFELKNEDARKIIKKDNNQYDLIFLDAFTPSKCPCLWSYEFFQQLHDHLKPDGMILTYSTSTAVRAAMIEAGLVPGYIYNKREDKFTGTIAARDKSLIKYPLSKFDLGLLKTSAGIFYRDENLTGQNEAIIKRRKIEVDNCNRISSSSYKKNFTPKTL